MKYKFVFVTALIVALTSASLWAQTRGGGAAGAAGQRGEAPQPPQAPRAMAPIDLTGYWVSIVSEDWRFRMLTPPKGDFPDFLLTPDATKIADAWDPAKDQADKDHCKAYGAANIMRVPGRFHITWADDRTLKIETDAGMQTRLLRFPAAGPAAPAGPPSRQGNSAAQWER